MHFTISLTAATTAATVAIAIASHCYQFFSVD